MGAQIAIVGSGPAGMYAADALLKNLPLSRIDVFDRLPSPFGLIRAGVAPDHYKTKNTARQFARTLELEQVRYLGNVEIGRDLDMDELKANYDAVVLAIGAYNDRKLGIPGEELPGVYGACAFVGWYNGHPDYRGLDPLLDRAGVAVIGIGNVALDVCRVLAKTPAEMAGSDICRHAADAIQAATLSDLHMFGRRGPNEAGFTPKELGEIGHMERCQALVDGGQLPDQVSGDFEGRLRGVKEKNLGILKALAGAKDMDKPIKMHLRFFAAPRQILGTDRVEGLRVEKTELVDGRAQGTGETFDVEVGAVISAIGYHTVAPAGIPMNGGTVANQDGRVEAGVYVVGWSKRGPSGTIPTNGPDSRAVADLIASDIAGSGKGGGAAIDALLTERNVRVVNFAEWKIISAAEAERAEDGHPQEKFTRIAEMLAVIDG